MNTLICLIFLLSSGCFSSGGENASTKNLKSKKPTIEEVGIKKTAPIAFRLPPDSTGIGSFRLVQLVWETGEKPMISDTLLPDTAAVQVSITTKSGHAFSVFLRKQEVVKNDSFAAPDSLIAISDIEGNFDAFAEFLITRGVVDSSFNWTFGNNRLALPGDFFDRGDEVFEVLWLIYKLEQEAEAAGGGVHFILGNHEYMNLSGDHRYVHPKYTVFAKELGIPYADWLAPGSVLGDWLRTKNCMEKIGETLFVHAGLSPQVADSSWTIRDINEINRLAMNSSLDALRQKCQVIIGSNGPLWYRDMSLGKLKQRKVNKMVAQYDAKRVVIGHTIIDGEHITSLYKGRVINIDLHHSVLYGKGIVRGLLVTSEGLFEIDNTGGNRILKSK